MAKTIGLTFMEKPRTRRTVKAEAPVEAPAAETIADKEVADDEKKE